MLNKKAFADLLDVDLHTTSRWELCQSEPSPESIDAIARVLRYPKAFFFGEDIDAPVSEGASFRSQTSMSASERDAALAAVQISFLLADWVDEKFNLPEINVPDLHLYSADPETGAQILRQEWGLGEKPITNMVQLLESRGVIVFSLAENTATVDAYSVWRKNRPFVYLNTFKSAERSRFDAAHELAHLVLHRVGSVTGRIAEDQANRFASAFLMPEIDVRSRMPRGLTIHQLISMKNHWKVSLAALNYRIHKLGITTAWKNRDLCIEIAKRGFHKTEPDGIPREKSVLWDKVLKALWSEKTTHSDIAKDISLPTEEVADLLFGILGSVPTDKAASRTPLSIVPFPSTKPPERDSIPLAIA